MSELHSPRCYSSHLGTWACKPDVLRALANEYQSGRLQPLSADERDEDHGYLYRVTSGGVAIIHINGMMMKKRSKFGGASTIEVREAIRTAADDEEVGAIVLVVDSPGGTSAGTQQLADDVVHAKEKKPVFAHGEDLVASAAYWAVSGATEISASPTSEIGSIGTYMVIEDASEAYKEAGIQVHLISTGEHKGVGAHEGVEITEDQLDEFQRNVDGLNKFFLSSIAAGRQRSAEWSHRLATGQVWIAAEAQEMGLIDEVRSLDETVAKAEQIVDRETTTKRDSDSRKRRLRMV